MVENNIKFISIPTISNINSPKLIKKEFDHQFDPEMFNNLDDKQIPLIYQQIYDYFKNENKDNKLITISEDSSVSASTISAINEKYIIRNGDKFSSNLRILYIDACPDIDTENSPSNSPNNFQNKIVSSLTGLLNNTYTNHKLLLKPEQIIYFGINKNITENNQIMLLDQLEIKYFTLDRINKIGIEKILNHILKEFDNYPIHLVMDLSVFDTRIVPNKKIITNHLNEQIIFSNQGFDFDQVNKIIECLKNKINTFDVVGFNLTCENNINDKLTIKLIKTLIVGIMNVQEKKLNIFTEDSRFLIYRPVEQENGEDIGWYILRFMNLEQREEILKNINLDDIHNITIDDENDNECDIYISSTTVNEQEIMSYYVAQNIIDKCLFPPEKMIMLFELLNTPNNSIIHE